MSRHDENDSTEDSVLFSLNSLAAAGDADHRQREVSPPSQSADQSGLIDLATLQQLSASAPDRPGVVCGDADPITPALFNVSRRPRRPWLALTLLAALVLTAAAGLLGVYLDRAESPDRGEAPLLAALGGGDEYMEGIAADGINIRQMQYAQTFDERLAQNEAQLVAMKRLPMQRSEANPVEHVAEASPTPTRAPRTPRGPRRVSTPTPEASTATPTPETTPPSFEAVLGIEEKAITDETIQRVLNGWSVRLQRCGEASGALTIDYSIATDGRVSGIRSRGKLAGSETAKCVEGVFAKMRFPTPKGTQRAVKKTFSLSY